MATPTPTAQRFRERPRPPDVVEARQLEWREEAEDLVAWVTRGGGSAAVMGFIGNGPPVVHLYGEDGGCNRVHMGDWIIRHAADQFTVMSPDEFARRYEPLPESAHDATEPPVGEADPPHVLGHS